MKAFCLQFEPHALYPAVHHSTLSTAELQQHYERNHFIQSYNLEHQTSFCTFRDQSSGLKTYHRTLFFENTCHDFLFASHMLCFEEQ